MIGGLMATSASPINGAPMIRLCPSCDNCDPSQITPLPKGAIEEAPTSIQDKIAQYLNPVRWCQACRVVFLEDVVADYPTPAKVPVGLYYPIGNAELEGWRRLRPGYMSG
jgi:hypothetical protein